MGDANIDANKWMSPSQLGNKVATKLKACLDRNGFSYKNIGNTYFADHAQSDGKIAESALDHVYSNGQEVKTVIIPNCSSQFNLNITKSCYIRKITKRSFKNYTIDKWNASLMTQPWSQIKREKDIEKKTDMLAKFMNTALDEVAPIKLFTVKSNYKFGISDDTKEIMKNRDATRAKISKASTKEKSILWPKYKKLRNRVNARIRKETVEFNNKRIEKANSEKEVWNVINEVNKPQNKNNWTLKTNSGETSDHETIAEEFNVYFKTKIETLKDNIDDKLKVDPLSKIKIAMAKKNEKEGKKQFNLTKTTETEVKKALKKMKSKKSAGVDGISQKILVQGAPSLASCLTEIFNSSIEEGVFPQNWKEALVTPVLKKGDPKLVENYRPVSCLPAASKVLEIIICDQTTRFVEDNNILPPSQHGFRSGKSTMSAWSEMQQNWSQNTEAKNMTGILLWDLSAAFDTLDAELLCKKLEVYGFTKKTVKWYKSFLSNRTQRVKIEDSVSGLVNLTSGVPQGGILSPLLFIIFVADLQLWLKFSKSITYADDTQTGVSGRILKLIIEKMEADAVNVLKFMSSNGLVANSKKTTLLFLNLKASKNPIKIKIGNDEITQVSSAKLLGMNMHDSQTWKSHIQGSGGIIPNLNKRLFQLRRLRNHLSEDSIKKVADSIYTSKIRYGLQLCSKVRWSDSETRDGVMEQLQKTQNKLFRFLNKTKISDKIRTSEIMEKLNLLSINQINAQIKLMETWKALNNDKDNPIKSLKITNKKKGTKFQICLKWKPG